MVWHDAALFPLRLEVGSAPEPNHADAPGVARSRAIDISH